MKKIASRTFSSPKSKYVEEIKQKLIAQGVYNRKHVLELQQNLVEKKAKLHFFAFIKRREIEDTVAALSHLLEKEL
ncbi:MAG: hypothetical protein AAF554_05525 [Bacteroidota bacterium]